MLQIILFCIIIIPIMNTIVFSFIGLWKCNNNIFKTWFFPLFFGCVFILTLLVSYIVQIYSEDQFADTKVYEEIKQEGYNEGLKANLDSVIHQKTK